MADYLTGKNRFGRTGVSADAVLSLAKLAAGQVSGLEVLDHGSTCRIYGEQIKVIIAVAIAAGLDVVAKCQEAQEEIASAIRDQLEIRLFDARVVAEGNS